MSGDVGDYRDEQLPPSVSDRAVLAACAHWPELTAMGTTAAALGGTAKDVALTVSAQAAADFVSSVRRSIGVKREARAEETTQTAAEMTGREISALLTRILDDDALLDLAGVVLEAAARAREEGRRRALARCLANGVTDGTNIDREELIARAIADLEPPHVQLLARLSLPAPGSPAAFVRWPIYSLDLLRASLPAMEESLDSLLATLERNGLIFAKAANHFAKRDYNITDAGRRVLRRLEDEGLVVERPADDRDLAKWSRWREEQASREEETRRLQGEQPR